MGICRQTVASTVTSVPSDTPFILVMILAISLIALLGVMSGEASFADVATAEFEAFARCDTDRMIGLTWREVEQCEELYSDWFSANSQKVPTREDFDFFDEDKDGTLTKEEWFNKMNPTGNNSV